MRPRSDSVLHRNGWSKRERWLSCYALPRNPGVLQSLFEMPAPLPSNCGSRAKGHPDCCAPQTNQDRHRRPFGTRTRPRIVSPDLDKPVPIGASLRRREHPLPGPVSASRLHVRFVLLSLEQSQIVEGLSRTSALALRPPHKEEGPCRFDHCPSTHRLVADKTPCATAGAFRWQ